jgi:hypothetical protein
MRDTEKVAIGFVDHGTVRGEFANDLFRLGAARPERFVSILNVQDNVISRGRNLVVKYFLQTSADWLFMLDADQRFTPESYDVLTGAADAEERPVLTGLYFGVRRIDGLLYPLPLPNIFSKKPDDPFLFDHILHYPPNALVQVDGCGAGMLLVHRRVFEEIQRNCSPEYAETCWFNDRAIPNGGWLSEDIAFCLEVRRAGIPIHCHTGVVSPHIKHYLVDDTHFENSKVALDSAGFPM